MVLTPSRKRGEIKERREKHQVFSYGMPGYLGILQPFP